jgi:DNA polymerase III subunit delta
MQGNLQTAILRSGGVFMSEFIKAIDAVKKTSDLQPVYALVGTEHALKRRFMDAISKQVLRKSGEYPEWSRFYFDETGADGAVLACQSLSLFAVRNFVWLENCSLFLANAKLKFDTAELERYLENPNPDSVLVICVPGEKLDERKKSTKLLKRYPIVDCNTPKEDAALKLAASFAEDLGIQIDKDALSELWRRTTNLTSMETELQKLWTYTGGSRIDFDAVSQLVAPHPEDNVFTWIDWVTKGKLDLVYRSLSDIQKAGYDGFALLAMMARQIRLMWFAKVLGAMGQTHQQIASKVGAHPYAVKIAAAQAEHFSQKRLEEMLTAIADGEYDVKSGRRDIMQVLDYVILSFAAKTPTGV